MAVKTSDLRIGNYLHADFAPVRVVELSERTFRAVEDEVFPEADECEPIPLTEEWLGKLGFEKDSAPNCWVLNDLVIYTKNEANDIRCPHAFTLNYRGPVLFPYVHQLQNLYYSLTGEELQIKEA